MGVLKTSGIVLFTAVVVALLPGYLKPKLETNIQGSAAPGWEEVEAIFRRQVESGEQKGGGFSVYYRGERVVNLVGGYADPEANIPWAEDTISEAFSSTKGVSALVIAMLVDRGLLDYKKKVAAYWPEFAVNGKEEITIEQLFSHQAGLAVIDEEFSLEDIKMNTARLGHALANQKPYWTPGKGVGYHAVSLGLYQDQVVRRVDPQHRSLSQFFKEEIADLLGIDFQIGLPLSEQWRCTRMIPQSILESLREIALHPGQLSMIMAITDKNALLWKTIRPRFIQNWNHYSSREVPIASVCGFGTAESLAKLYGVVANGGRYKGKPLYSEQIIKKLDEIIVTGSDLVLGGMNVTNGRGFLILPNGDDTSMTFGTPGAGGQMAYGDLKYRLGWAYLSNFHSSLIITDTYKELWTAMYKTVQKLNKK